MAEFTQIRLRRTPASAQALANPAYQYESTGAGTLSDCEPWMQK